MPSLAGYVYLHCYANSPAQQTRIMFKSKTVISAVGAALGAAGAAMEGSLEWSAAIQIMVTSVLAIFLRHGVKKAESAASGE